MCPFSWRKCSSSVPRLLAWRNGVSVQVSSAHPAGGICNHEDSAPICGLCAIVGQNSEFLWAGGCCGASSSSVVWPARGQCSTAGVFGASPEAGASAGSCLWLLAGSGRRFLGNSSCHHRDVGLAELCGQGRGSALLPPLLPAAERRGAERSVPARSCSRQNTGPCPLLHFWGKGEDKGSVALFLHLPKVYLQGFQFSALHLRCLSRSCLHLFCVLAHL